MVFFGSGSQGWYFSHDPSSLFHCSVLVDFSGKKVWSPEPIFLFGNGAWQREGRDLTSIMYYYSPVLFSALSTQKWSQGWLVAECGFVVSFV